MCLTAADRRSSDIIAAERLRRRYGGWLELPGIARLIMDKIVVYVPLMFAMWHLYFEKYKK